MYSAVHCLTGPVLGPLQQVVKPEEFSGGHKDIKGLDRVKHKERLEELDFFSLEKRGLKWDLVYLMKYLNAIQRKEETSSS